MSKAARMKVAEDILRRVRDAGGDGVLNLQEMVANLMEPIEKSSCVVMRIPASESDELAQTRIQLQHVRDELDAVRLEFESYQAWFRGLDIKPNSKGTNNDAQWLAQSWINALGGKLIPKHHLIDALVLTTKKVCAQAGWPPFR